MKNGNLIIRASNSGDRRVRLTSLQLTGPSGPLIKPNNGLAGYVLGGATNTIFMTKAPKGIKAGSQVKIAANSDNGPVQGVVHI